MVSMMEHVPQASCARPRHPMTPVRVELTIDLARASEPFPTPKVSVERPAPATDMQLETVHLQQYVAAVQRAGGSEPDSSVRDFGLGTGDDPVLELSCPLDH